jgi:hypothetical protein
LYNNILNGSTVAAAAIEGKPLMERGRVGKPEKSSRRGLFARDAVRLLHSQAAFGIALPLGGAPPKF